MFRVEWNDLLSAARGGDASALGELLTVARDDLHETASGVLGRGTRARLPVDDVLSDALIAVVREIGNLRATNYVGFRYWFASIARNSVRRNLRRDRNRPEVNVDAESDGEGERKQRALPAESVVIVREALDRLPRSQQVAYILREGLALSWTTIGFVADRRAAPAARLLHYRASAHMKQAAEVRTTLCFGPVIQA